MYIIVSVINGIGSVSMISQASNILMGPGGRRALIVISSLNMVVSFGSAFVLLLSKSVKEFLYGQETGKK